MQTLVQSSDRVALLVLLIGSVSGATLALAGWLQQQERIAVIGPLPAVMVATLPILAGPAVVVIDADGLKASLTKNIGLLRSRMPLATLIVLSCDASEALRRHCRGAGVHAVFSKNDELDQLAAMLAQRSGVSASVSLGFAR